MLLLFVFYVLTFGNQIKCWWVELMVNRKALLRIQIAPIIKAKYTFGTIYEANILTNPFAKCIPNCKCS